MAGQLKEVRNRIKSVQSTQQITKAMKMVSAAKLRRAQDAIVQMRPYAKKMLELLSNIVNNADDSSDLEITNERPIEKVLLIVVTSDRGLCGAFNSNLIKLAKQTIDDKYTDAFKKGNVTIWNIGKKGFEGLTKAGYKTNDTFKDIFLHLSFENVQAAAQAAMKAYENKEFDTIEIIYSEFKNAGTQYFIAEQLLPAPREQQQVSGKKADFIFEPPKDQLLAALIPKIVNTRVFKSILDSSASEHGARMTAMDKASENANEILKSLKISYNRARQAAITTELTEIVSGAAALRE